MGRRAFPHLQCPCRGVLGHEEVALAFAQELQLELAVFKPVGRFHDIDFCVNPESLLVEDTVDGALPGQLLKLALEDLESFFPVLISPTTVTLHARGRIGTGLPAQLVFPLPVHPSTIGVLWRPVRLVYAGLAARYRTLLHAEQATACAQAGSVPGVIIRALE